MVLHLFFFKRKLKILLNIIICLYLFIILKFCNIIQNMIENLNLVKFSTSIIVNLFVIVFQGFVKLIFIY